MFRALLLRHQEYMNCRSIKQLLHNIFTCLYICMCRSQWSRGLRRGSTAARLLRLWVRIPPGARMSVCCECCVLSGRGLCDGLITRPEESYQLWCVVVCDLEPSRMGRPLPALGRSATGKYICTYCMVQRPSWEGNWFAASQEIPRISRDPKVHYRTHRIAAQ